MCNNYQKTVSSSQDLYLIRESERRNNNYKICCFYITLFWELVWFSIKLKNWTSHIYILMRNLRQPFHNVKCYFEIGYRLIYSAVVFLYRQFIYFKNHKDVLFKL